MLIETLQKILKQYLCTTYLEIRFQKWFWTSGFAGTENVESTPIQHFQFKQFLRSKIIFESRFIKKFYISIVLKKIERCNQYLISQKWISHCIFKS